MKIMKIRNLTKNTDKSSCNKTSKLKSFIIRTALLTVLAAFIIITHTGCGDDTPLSKSDFCLDTTCQISIYDNIDETEGEEILKIAFAQIRDYENILSKTISDSDIAKINASGGQWTKVYDETVEVIKVANTVSYESGGVFDITIGGVTDLWDFKSENPQIPDDSDIRQALQHVDYTQVTADRGKILLSDTEARIDLGGVAKGYIADKICEFLEEQGISRAIVNLGGNVAVIGEKDEDVPWTVGIERPFTDRTELVGTVKVSDATVVTSGIYERNFEKDGRIYHHILDPKTGYPAETDLDAVTIIAAKGNSGFCDAVSTACLIMGKEKAIEFIGQLQIKYPDKELEAAFIDNSGNIVQTDGMEIEFE